MPSRPPSDEEIRHIATVIAGRDPHATITARGAIAATALATDATVRAPTREPAAVTVPTLPRLAVAEQGAIEGADFEVSGVLGEGGMGRVLLARQRSLRREVAVKVLRGEPHPEIVDALLAEAVVTGSLEHPNVVPVHALGLDASERPVLVMKRIEGVSFGDLVRDPAHPMWSSIAEDARDRLDAKIEIVMSVCNAAHFAHSRGILHRDIKLDNVMIGSFGEVYLVDWGIAARITEREAISVRPGLVVGTPAYLAPEMVASSFGALDARTDVYLLGATLHAALTGEPRHKGATLYDLLRSACESAPFAYGPDVPAELGAIANRAMAALREDRFASALDLRRALAAFRRHRASIALSDEAAARLAALGRGDGDERRAHALMTECRFGFTQALRDWPGNAAARAGLTECLARMIEHELGQRDLEGARALYAELAEPRPDLAARIEALAAELAAAADREAKLRALERDRDMTVGGRTQMAIIGLFPIFGLSVVAFVAKRRFQVPSAAEIVAVPAIILVMLSVAFTVMRRRLPSAITRKAVLTVMVAPAAVTTHRLLAVVAGIPVSATFMGDLMIAAAVSGAIGVALVPRLAWAAAPFSAAAIAIALRPDLTLQIFAGGLLTGLATMFIAWRLTVRG